MKRFLILAACALAACVQARAPRLTDGVLAVHNSERALVGVPALTSDSDLTTAAEEWAQRLAQTGVLAHSPQSSRPGEGENLAMGTAGAHSAADLAGSWAAEKSNFVDGIFPNVSRTGNWTAVGHYTQMVWRNTARIGCGTATGGGNLYLVCRYAPQGNIVGQRVY
jgi:uncharacterized protein YkwD